MSKPGHRFAATAWWTLILLSGCVGGDAPGNGDSFGAAEPLASDQDRPRGIAVTPDYVVWLNEGDGDQRAGTVMALATGGVAAPKIVASNHRLPQTIVASGSGAYYSVAKTSLDNCQTAGVFHVDPESGTRDHVWSQCIEDWDELANLFAIGPSSLFIVGHEYEKSDLVAVPHAGGSEQRLAEYIGGVAAIAYAQSHVYWGRSEGPEVVRISAGGGEVETVIPNLLLADMVSSGDVLFWATAGGVIERYDLSDGSREVIADEQHGVAAIAVHGDDVFWIRRSTDSGSVWAGGIGKTPKAFAEDLVEPYDVTATADGVYFVDRAAGEVWKIPR